MTLSSFSISLAFSLSISLPHCLFLSLSLYIPRPLPLSFYPMSPLQAACHKERHVSQKAVSFIHDVLMEVLTSWAELPHFHFNEALFRPFEHIMQLELCDEDVQDQVRALRSECKVLA